MDRETVWQVGVAVGAVLLFLGILVAVSSTFAANGNITATGGFALVGAVTVFILVMNGAGLWLERMEFDEDDS
jgi:ABC-type nickel/cobalt efflux system permease component RcnA